MLIRTNNAVASVTASPKQIIAVGILLFTLISIPAFSAQWYKPGASPEETNVLVAQCQLEAAKSTASMDPITYGRTQREANILGFGKALLATITQSNIFTLCLKSKGFTDGESGSQTSAYLSSKYQLPPGYQTNPGFKVEIPSFVEEGGVVPINLYFDPSNSGDPVESVSVIVESNPIEHRHVITVQYHVAPEKVGLRLRARFARTTKPTVAAVVTTRSGKSFSHSFGPDRIAKFVDFAAAETLIPIPASTAKLFSSQELGQQRAMLRDGYLTTIIYHPMFPAMADRPALSIERISVKTSNQNEELLTATLGSSLSNNPLVAIYTGNINGTVLWTGPNQPPYTATVRR